MSNDIAIKVDNLTKIYKLYDSPQDRLKEALNPFRRKYHHDFHALTDVSMEIRKGETVGILGQNGAGKSTLLKLITGIINPSSGSVQVNGRISALLELGAGFNPEISGLENVYFNGTIQGFSREQMDAKLDDILSFADIGDFIHQRVKIYSSGMFLRLAFAVAVNIDPEILIIDEALSVGDVMFQGKCMDRIKTMMNNGVTTLFVTHSMDTVNTLCDYAYMLDGGKIFTHGKAQVVTLQYYQMVREREHANQELQNAESQAEKDAIREKYGQLVEQIKEKSEQENFRYGTGGANITRFSMLNSEDVESNIFKCGERFKVRLSIEFLSDVEYPCFGYVISDVAGQNLLSIHTFHDGDIKFEPKRAGDTLDIEMETDMVLNPGKYLLSIGVSDARTLNDFKNLDARKNICKVEVYGKEYYHGIIHHGPKVHILNQMEQKSSLTELQEMFIRWNAERKDISIEESLNRFKKSMDAINGGHQGKEYRQFCTISHDVFSVFFDDSRDEVYEAYKFHGYLHFLRMLSYRKPAWSSNDPVVAAQGELPEVIIMDFGCGMAQSSFALARLLAEQGKKVQLTLVDIPTIIKEFLVWVAQREAFSVTYLDCTADNPIPVLPRCNVCIATEIFEHLHDPLSDFKNIDNALLPNGFLVTDISDHAPEFMHVSPDLKPLRELLSSLGYAVITKDRLFRKAGF